MVFFHLFYNSVQLLKNREPVIILCSILLETQLSLQILGCCAVGLAVACVFEHPEAAQEVSSCLPAV